MNVWDIWRFIFKKKKIIFRALSSENVFFFLEILISPLPSSNKCILVLNNFSYNINTDKEHHFRPLIREIQKLEQSTKPSSDPWQNHISFCLYLFSFLSSLNAWCVIECVSLVAKHFEKITHFVKKNVRTRSDLINALGIF